MTYRKRTLTEMAVSSSAGERSRSAAAVRDVVRGGARGGCAGPGGDGRGHGNARRGSVGPDGAPEGGGRAGCRRTVVGLVGEGRGYAEAASELRSPFASPGAFTRRRATFVGSVDVSSTLRVQPVVAGRRKCPPDRARATEHDPGRPVFDAYRKPPRNSKLHKRLHTHRTLEAVQVQPTEKVAISAAFVEPSDGLEPSTPSLPWRFRGVTRVHARSSATRFLLQIGLMQRGTMRRETSRVSFLMCPFCVRAELFS